MDGFGTALAVTVVGLALAGFLLDRLMCALERRGFVYWRHRKAPRGTMANAFLEIESLVTPSKAHVVVERKRAPDGDEGEGDGKPPRPIV